MCINCNIILDLSHSAPMSNFIGRAFSNASEIRVHKSDRLVLSIDNSRDQNPRKQKSTRGPRHNNCTYYNIIICCHIVGCLYYYLCSHVILHLSNGYCAVPIPFNKFHSYWKIYLLLIIKYVVILNKHGTHLNSWSTWFVWPREAAFIGTIEYIFKRLYFYFSVNILYSSRSVFELL